MLTCKKCLIQYVGKTVDKFRYGWKNCRNNSRNYDWNQSCMQRILITLIDRTDPSDPWKREDYWKRTLCFMAPYGVIIKDHIWSIPLKLCKLKEKLCSYVIFILWRAFTALLFLWRRIFNVAYYFQNYANILLVKPRIIV